MVDHSRYGIIFVTFYELAHLTRSTIDFQLKHTPLYMHMGFFMVSFGNHVHGFHGYHGYRTHACVL